jgi:hypothetical protein
MRGVVMLEPALRVLLGKAGSGDASAGWLTKPNATLIAAVIAALAALYAAWRTSRTAKLQRRRDDRDKDVEHRREQLNQLYGPIYMRRLASKSTYTALRARVGAGPAGAEPRWALVDNIEDIHRRQDPLVILAVTNILKINKEIEDILKGKYGLLNAYPPPRSFDQFITHAEQLQLAWDQKIDLDERISFPREFDKDIECALTDIRTKLNNMSVSKRQWWHRG